MKFAEGGTPGGGGMSQNVGIVVVSIASLFVSIITGPFMSKKVLKSFILMLHVSGFVLRLARVESVSPNPAIFRRQDMVPPNYRILIPFLLLGCSN